MSRRCPHLIYVHQWTQFTFSKRCPSPPSENLAREFDKFASVTRLVYAIRGRHGCVLLFGKPVSRRLIEEKKRRIFAEARIPYRLCCDPKIARNAIKRRVIYNDLMGEKRKKFLSSFRNKSRPRKGIGDKGTCNRCFPQRKSLGIREMIDRFQWTTADAAAEYCVTHSRTHARTRVVSLGCWS